MRNLNRAKHNKFLLTIVLSTLLIFLSTFTSPVQAQTNGTLFVSPPQSSVPAQSQITIQLDVSDVANINAFDFTIEYDETILDLEDWTYGDFLSNLFTVYSDNLPGFFRLACTQLATPAASGSGTLINLIFRAKAIGTSTITITSADFSDSQGNPSSPALTNGSVQVSNAPTYTPTFTNTATPTRTYTPSPTVLYPINTFTPTRTQLAPLPSPTPVELSPVPPQLPTVPAAQLTQSASLTAPIPDPTLTTATPSPPPDHTQTPTGTLSPTPNIMPGEGVFLTKTPNKRADETWLWLLLLALLLIILALAVIYFKRRQALKKKSSSD